MIVFAAWSHCMGFIYENVLRAKAEALAGQDTVTAGRRHKRP